MATSSGGKQAGARGVPGQAPVRRRFPKRVAGEMSTAAFLEGLLELARERLPRDLRECQSGQQWSLAKLWYDDPLIHYEVWPHRARERLELALHFETRDPRRNAALLEYVADELLFLKAALGDGLEAEPWDKGWTRMYLTLPLEPLLPDFQARVAEQLAFFVETLEPLRRDSTQTSSVDPTGPAEAASS